MEQCPDEYGRIVLPQWMLDTGTLPVGNEPEVMIGYGKNDERVWGFSYALRPYLPAMLSVPFMRIAAALTSSERALLFAARLPSVLSVVACCLFCLLMGRRLFKGRYAPLLLASVVCLTPQVLFLGMYHNNDVVALAGAAAALFFFIDGQKTCWAPSRCLGLAVSFSVILLSYYSAYGWVLVPGIACIISVLRDERIRHKEAFLAGRIAMVAGICALLAGWFFVRNAMLHDGDFLGLRSELASREALASQGVALYVKGRTSSSLKQGTTTRRVGSFVPAPDIGPLRTTWEESTILS